MIATPMAARTLVLDDWVEFWAEAVVVVGGVIGGVIGGSVLVCPQAAGAAVQATNATSVNSLLALSHVDGVRCGVMGMRLEFFKCLNGVDVLLRSHRFHNLGSAQRLDGFAQFFFGHGHFPHAQGTGAADHAALHAVEQLAHLQQGGFVVKHHG
jgi:hypothetical protein